MSINISVLESKVHGKGVFANKFLNKNEVIEQCSFTDFESLIEKDDDLEKYTFELFDKKILPSGLCIYLNSSKNPNVRYEFDLDKNLIVFYTTRDIQKDEELFLMYEI